MKAVSQYRFNALIFGKLPHASIYSKELEWYSDEDERVLGAVFIDRTDRDYNHVVLGRDERSLFRCFDLGVSYENID